MVATESQLRAMARCSDIAWSDYEGWLPAPNLPTLHYFRQGRSLCHLFRTSAPWEEMIPDVGRHPSQCETCCMVLDSEHR